METLPIADPEPFRLALRVRHPSMDPAELSAAFGITPEYCFRAGDPCLSRSGGLTHAPVHPESYWLGEVSPIGQQPSLGLPIMGDPRIAERQIAALRRSLSWALSLGCSGFFKTHAELLRRIRHDGGEVALLVTIYSADSFSLPPTVTQLLGDLGITIEFELAGE